MRPGWRTSELTFGGLTGLAICELVSRKIETTGEGIALAGACLALAWVAGKYAHSRAEAKRAP